jgi:hypothetical protein
MKEKRMLKSQNFFFGAITPYADMKKSMIPAVSIISSKTITKGEQARSPSHKKKNLLTQATNTLHPRILRFRSLKKRPDKRQSFLY